jgi:aerobic-type carbon monoxide dehydrogenase small subunit (CoxS/CutS family)
VRTVESLADPEGPLSPLQEAFRRHHALQCGFCTPGILMSAAELLAGDVTPTRRESEELLSGHLCRCTSYEPIVAAIAEGAGSEA